MVRFFGHSNGFFAALSRKLLLLCLIIFFIACPIVDGLPSPKAPLTKTDSYGHKRKAHPDEFIVKFKTEIFCESTDSLIITRHNQIDSLFRIFKVCNFKRLFQKYVNQNEKSEYKKYKPTNELENSYVFKLQNPHDLTNLLSALSKVPIVIYAEPNYFYKSYAKASALPLMKRWVFQKTQITSALKIESSDSVLIIGIIDTGIEEDAAAIADMLWINEKEIPANGVDDDGNGFIDDICGWDFVSIDSGYVVNGEDANPRDNNPADFDGHGSLMAKTIAQSIHQAVNETDQKFKASLMTLRAGFKATDNTGLFKADDCAEAIFYAAENQAKIIQLSWGGPHFSNLLRDVISYAAQKQCIVIAAAGNENRSKPHYPAAYDDVWAVASTDEADKKDSFSNYGPWITLSAPGSSINTLSEYEDFADIRGTSSAASLVTGLAALMLINDPGIAPDTLKKRIVCSADNIDSINPDFEGLLGAGRINAWRAMNNIKRSNLILRSFRIRDAAGNIKQRVDAGEAHELLLTLENVAYDAHGIWLRLTTNSQYIFCTNPEQTLGSVAYLDSVDNSFNPFNLTIEAGAPNNFAVICSLQISDHSGFEKSIPIPIVISAPDSIEIPVEENSIFVNRTCPFNSALSAECIAGDFDGDGNIDIVSVSRDSLSTHNSKLILFFGDGRAGFEEVDLGDFNPTDVRAGDLDRDGLLDLLVSDESSKLIFLKNEGQRVFQRQEIGNLNFDRIKQIELLDFDLDGDPDIFVNSDKLILLQHTPDLHFVKTDSIAQFKTALFKCHDLNGDAYPDIICVPGEENGIRLALNDGAGHFALTNSGIESAVRIKYLALIDFTADAVADLITIQESFEASREIVVYRNNGAGYFTETQRIPKPGAIHLTIGDVDCDGDFDFIAENADSATVLFSNDGTGHFQEDQLFTAEINSHAGLLPDVDKDGDPDYIEISRNQPACLHLSKLADDLQLEHLDPPQQLIAVIDLNRAKLSWQSAAGHSRESAESSGFCQLRAGTIPGGDNVVSAAASLSPEINSSLRFTYLTKLKPGTDYYWSVRSVDYSGRTSDWADEQSFRIKNTPPGISHFFPANDTTICEGDSLHFQIDAIDKESDSLYIVWRTTALPDSAELGPQFIYVPGFSAPREDTIQAYISDGDTTIAHYWFISIKNVNLPPQISSVFPGADTTISEGDSIALCVSVMNLDSDSLRYFWFVNGVADTSQKDSAYFMAFDYNSAGLDTVLVEISDSDTSIAHSWLMTIQNSNRLPEIVSVFPPADTTIYIGDSLKYKIRVNDPDHDSLRCNWSINNICDTTAVDTVFMLVADTVSAGTDTIKVRVADADSFIVYTWAVTIRQINYAPVLTACHPAADTLTIFEGDSVKLSLGAIDANNDSLAFFWLRAQSGQDTVGTDSIYRFCPGYFSAGLDTITAIISDGDSSVSRTWRLRILNVNQAPGITFTWPPPQSMVTEGDTVLFRIRFQEPDSQETETIWIVNGVHDTTGSDTSLQFSARLDSTKNDTIVCYISDPDTTVFYVWSLKVKKFNLMPEISAYFPQADTALVEGDTLIFRLSAIDADEDSLCFKWQVNGIIDSVESDSQFIFVTNFNSAGIDTIKGWVCDGDTMVFQQWLVKVINLNRSPDVPELLLPENGRTISQMDLLSWITSDPDIEDSTLTYCLDISLDSLFRTIVAGDTNIAAKSIRLNRVSGSEFLFSGRQYYWRVKAIDSFGDSSGFSTDRAYFVFYKPSVKITRQFAQLNEDGSITVCWETEYERDNAGFNVQRATSQAGPFLRINQSLIRGGTAGSYSFDDKAVTGGVTYFYEIENVTQTGRTTRHNTFSIKTPVPEKFELYQNYPNPFNLDTVIRYQIPHESRVFLSVHNILGRMVRKLVDENKKAGFYNVYWDGKDKHGRDVGSGIYFYNIYAGKFHQTRKLIVVR